MKVHMRAGKRKGTYTLGEKLVANDISSRMNHTGPRGGDRRV